MIDAYYFAVGIRDTNRVRLDYGVTLGRATSPITPPPTPEGLLYGAWDATGALEQGLYSSWHIEGAEVDVIYGAWS